jgi:pimeloyl-ACP methyl ester carboxylesterase
MATMATTAYYPYRSEAARGRCLAYLDSLAARQWPIESEERMVPTTYGATFVRISGPRGGPPLVLLHGAGTTSLMWAPNIGTLSAELRTFAVDQVGEFGRSCCAKPVRSLSDLPVWLDELFDGLGLEGGVNLAGISYGGALAAQYALHFPMRLDKIVLIAPGATVLRPTAEFWARLILAAVHSRTGLPSFIHWMFSDMARKDPGWIEATVELLFLNMRSMARHKTPIPPVLTDAEWGGLTTPALFLVGEHEAQYSAEGAVRRLKRVAPGVIAEIVPGAGHDLTFVQASKVNQRILEFLKGAHEGSKACAC